jgi:probable rRNA maturation factor
MLNELELGDAELSLLLANDALIQELNRTYRSKARATDVLAFPQTHADHPGKLLGDIAISLDTAQRQAMGRRRSLFEEVRFLLAHGLLHLVGYDHGTPTEKREMTRLTRRLVRSAT